MHISDVTTLFDYNYWANERLLIQADQLAEAQLMAPHACSFGSLHGTLVHTLAAEVMWRSRMQEGLSPPALLTAHDIPTLAALRRYWAEEEQRMRGYLTTLDEATLAAPIHYTDTKGQQYSTPLWQALTHVVLHGMQHRSEAAAMLTEYGCSPGWIDFIAFVRQ